LAGSRSSLVAFFIGIVIWVFSCKRKGRVEANARIPLNDDKGYDDSKRG
jgi:cbb3-type cytochrome oxidase subunit 3